MTTNKDTSEAMNAEAVSEVISVDTLETVSGSFSVSGAWDDVKSAASSVENDVVNHPFETGATVATAVAAPEIFVAEGADALATAIIGNSAKAAIEHGAAHIADTVYDKIKSIL